MGSDSHMSTPDGASSSERSGSSTVMDLMVAAAVDQLLECQASFADVERIARRAGIEPGPAREVCPSDDALAEAVDTYGIVKLSDAITKALVAAPPGDNRAALIGLIQAYLDWARRNPAMYSVLLARIMRSGGAPSILRKYDASFVPLAHRYLDEPKGAPATRRAAFLRAMLLGLGHLAIDGHLALWTLPNDDPEAELSATVADFVDMLLAAPSQPIRSEA